jgi:hypothetical protein
VREALGALVAGWQAARAADPLHAAAQSIIAPDERRHAELARSVDRFLAPRLARAERRRVAEARRAAVADLGVPDRHPLASHLLAT